MKICGVDICIADKAGGWVSCQNCPHYTDADDIIRYLLNELKKEGGDVITYLKNLKNKFGYTKEY